MLRTFVHYGLHFLVPFLFTFFWPRRPKLQVYLLLLATMAIDLDHLLATPIFDPSRCSVGYHLLHSYPMIGVYTLILLLPYQRLGLPWWLRVIAVGLLFHIFTDWQDFYLWPHG